MPNYPEWIDPNLIKEKGWPTWFEALRNLHLFNVDNFNEFYKSNYLCMLKRVIEFTNFINKHDSEAQVIIQAGHNVPIFENETKRNEYHLLTIAKINKNCEDNLKDIQNHIDAVKHLISCSLK